MKHVATSACTSAALGSPLFSLFSLFSSFAFAVHPMRLFAFAGMSSFAIAGFLDGHCHVL
jgi:hypothetical protein